MMLYVIVQSTSINKVSSGLVYLAMARNTGLVPLFLDTKVADQWMFTARSGIRA